MNKLVIAAVVVAFGIGLTGCQTRITAEKNAEQVFLIQEKVTINGIEQIITKDVKTASGGWYATARSPLWATEGLEGLQIGVHTNGSVTLSLCGFPCLKRNTHPFYFTTLSKACQSLFQNLILKSIILYHMYKPHPRISTFRHAKTSKTVLQ